MNWERAKMPNTGNNLFVAAKSFPISKYLWEAMNMTKVIDVESAVLKMLNEIVEFVNSKPL